MQASLISRSKTTASDIERRKFTSQHFEDSSLTSKQENPKTSAASQVGLSDGDFLQNQLLIYQRIFSQFALHSRPTFKGVQTLKLLSVSFRSRYFLRLIGCKY